MSAIIQITGAVAITAGAILISLPAGLITGGIFAIIIGIALGR